MGFFEYGGATMNKAILGKKIGMTQIFLSDGRLAPVTVVEAGPGRFR